MKSYFEFAAPVTFPYVYLMLICIDGPGDINVVHSGGCFNIKIK